MSRKKEPGPKAEMPEGHDLKGTSYLTDADGNLVLQWHKTKRNAASLEATIDTIRKSLEGYTSGHLLTLPPKGIYNTDTITLIPLSDWHLGLYVWGQEASENWDLGKAERVIANSMAHLISNSPPTEECIILGGGDIMHSDNQLNRTMHSGHQLDVDGRWPKVLDAATRLTACTVDLALQRFRKVHVRILRGNHDDHSAIAVAYFLKAWFKDDPRVVVDTDPSLFWYMRFGRVLLGATHGHTVKVHAMPQIMAHRRAEDWGETDFRYVHGFHLHHTAKTVTEGNGCITEIHQSPIPQDAWHWGSGFLSGRSVQSIRYHKLYGETGRCRVAILPAR